MRRVPTELDVFGPSTPYDAAADEIVSFDEGRRRVESGEAAFINRGRAIRMFDRLESQPALRGESCRPGPELIVDVAVAHSHRARQVLDAWRPEAQNLLTSAKDLHEIGLQELFSGNLGAGIGLLVGARKGADQAYKDKTQANALDLKSLELNHQIALAKIDAAHAGDAALEGDARINAELEKRLATIKETQEFNVNRDRALRNPVSAQSGDALAGIEEAGARAEAQAQIAVQARAAAERASRQAAEAWRQVVGGEKSGNLSDLNKEAEAARALGTNLGQKMMDKMLRSGDDKQVEAAKKLAQGLREDIRMMDEMQRGADGLDKASQKAFRDAQAAATQAAHQQELQRLQGNLDSVQLDPKNRDMKGQLNRNALEQVRDIHNQILKEDARFVQLQEAIYAGDNEKVAELTKEGGQILLQQARQWTKDTEQITRQIQQKWQSMWRDVNQDLTQTVNNMLRGTQTIGQAFAKMFQEMELQVIDAAMMKLLQSVERLMNLGGGSQNASQQQLQQARQNNPPLVESYSAAAAAEAFAASGGNAAAAAMTYAEGMIYFPLASFDKGTSYVPRDGMAMLHRGEAVLPPPQTSELRNALSRRGRGGSGGGNALHVNPTYNINGHDHQNFKSMLRANNDELIDIVRDAYRGGKLTG